MISDYMEKANFEDTGFAYTLSLISGNTWCCAVHSSRS